VGGRLTLVHTNYIMHGSVSMTFGVVEHSIETGHKLVSTDTLQFTSCPHWVNTQWVSNIAHPITVDVHLCEDVF
jgi:hypothetical protein